MIDLAAREAEILGSLKDFQRATVERVVERFRTGQKRVLVADEVGLGKTLVAKGVIAKVARWHKEEKNDDIFRVVYICSNQSIAHQNITKLKIDAGVHVDRDSSTRLTMQTLKHFRQKNDPKLLEAFVQLVPLTPNTSFASTAGRGTKDERALIYAVLKRTNAFECFEPDLYKLLSMGVKDWDWWAKCWVEEQISKCGEDYKRKVIPRVEKALKSEKYASLSQWLLSACKDVRDGGDAAKHAYQLVHHLRRLMADISISFLDPDLVIMDEFQRFRELIRTSEDSEIGMLAKKFLHDTGCKVLLLSATPYKLYSTLDEIADNHGEDDHYKEFDEVVSFLYGQDSEMCDSFRDSWKSYSMALRQLDRVPPEDYRRWKSEVEDLLYGVMCRTERLQVAGAGRDIVHTGKAMPLKICQDDISSYIAADRVVLELSKHAGGALPPVEYVKSAPFILSFMEQYQLKKLMRRHRESIMPVIKRSKECWIPSDAIEQYQPISYPNSRLATLIDEAFAGGGELLIWVPPTLPYYELGGPFKKSSGFSKILVFSAWEMVPRMIASTVSYEAELRTIGRPSYKPRSENTEKRYSPEGENQHRFPSRRLDFGPVVREGALPSTMSLFTFLYPSRTLAALFNPVRTLGEDGLFPMKRRTVENQIRDRLRTMLGGLDKYQCKEKKRADAAWYWLAQVLLDVECYGRLQVMEWTSGLGKQQADDLDPNESRAKDAAAKLYTNHLAALQRAVEHPELLEIGPLPRDLLDVLIQQTLGSPAVCALRTTASETVLSNSAETDFVLAISCAHDIAMALRGKFNTPEATAILDLSYPGSDAFQWRKILRYCVDGNLQAVLDEYAHMLSDSYGLRSCDDQSMRDLAKLISQPLRTTTASYKVDTYSSFIGKGKTDTKNLRMRSHYAAGFYNVQSASSKDVQRTDQLRQAFNSPFWPFVLASTSIGQEGLDFHYYCRKIVHWNLPANPVELEQREGRINRYKGLAIRHGAVRRYIENGGSQFKENIWDELFEFCRCKEKGEHCELIPYWYLDPSGKQKATDHIERIVPMYPFSKDQAQYERLVSILLLYRITMGQPRQEELLECILTQLNPDDRSTLKEWFILLSPYYREKNGIKEARVAVQMDADNAPSSPDPEPYRCEQC